MKKIVIAIIILLSISVSALAQKKGIHEKRTLEALEICAPKAEIAAILMQRYQNGESMLDIIDNVDNALVAEIAGAVCMEPQYIDPKDQARAVERFTELVLKSCFSYFEFYINGVPTSNGAFINTDNNWYIK